MMATVEVDSRLLTEMFTTPFTPNVTVVVSNETVNHDFCGQGLKPFRDELTAIYGVLTAVICTLGLLTNILNIVVLTRKNMYSATNAILTGIAVADVLFLGCILTFNLINYDMLSGDHCFSRSYGLKLLSLITIRSALTSHSIAVVLTLILAIWRYVAVTYPLKIREWGSMYRTSVTIISCYIFVPIGNIMLYLCRTVGRVEEIKSSSALTIVVNPTENSQKCETNYDIVHTNLSDLGNSNFYNVAFWIYGASFKIVPSIALLVFSVLLVRTLVTSSKDRRKLTQNSNSRVDRSCERTTKMLLAILLFFLITELPQGILLVLVAVFGKAFYETCYSDLVEVNDLLEILNCSFNFVFYYAMSKQFRRTCLHLFTSHFTQDRSSTKSQESTMTQVETNC